jgi:hypothetical protein
VWNKLVALPKKDTTRIDSTGKDSAFACPAIPTAVFAFVPVHTSAIPKVVLLERENPSLGYG